MKRFIIFSLCALMTGFSYSQSSSQTISLPQGWSMFSTYIQPSQTNISAVMSPIISGVIIIKDGVGNIYWPQFGVNSIGNMQVGNGYHVKMSTFQNLSITGTQIIPENTALSLPQGWSLIGYLRIFPTNILSVFSQILNNFIIVKDENGDVYWPWALVNQIQVMKPGKGYQIKMLYRDTLIYNSNTFTCGTDYVNDIDGNYYSTVQIGNQCWMKKNLAATHYSDGTALVDGISAGNIVSDSTTKFWFVYNNNLSNKTTYGLLYTYAAAMNGSSGSNCNPSGVQGVCLSGWHIPSDAEWKQLEIFLGMNQSQADATAWRGTAEGGKLKEAGTMHWTNPNTGADNSSGFTGLPGGVRIYYGIFVEIGNSGYWCSATNQNVSMAWIRSMNNIHAQVSRLGNFRSNGLSVRCVKNN